MSGYSIIYNSSSLLTCDFNPEQGTGGSPCPPGAMGQLGEIPRGAIVFDEHEIIAVGETSQIQSDYTSPEKAVDAGGRLVMPSLVDAHTHLVFAGNRSGEMQMRLQGATYLDILKAGGGIHKTVQATREASQEELKVLGLKRLDTMLQHGTTTVEIKSGYGLNEETEHKILDVVRQLDEAHVMGLVATYLGAHTVPADIDRREYISWLKGEALRDYSKKAAFFDVFCEEGAFSAKETTDLFEAALQAGFKLKLHAGQFNDLNVCGAAAKMGAVSIDHLDHISDRELKLMGQHQCVGVLLPGVPFFLQTGIFPDVRRFKEAGVPFAIATDFNPGSCPSFSMLMMIALAVLKCHATVEEAIISATYNAACALRLGSSTGSLKKGKQADILVLDLEDYHEIPYYFGTNPVHSVWKDGKKVV